MADERDGGNPLGLLLYGGGGEQLEKSFELDDAFTDRGDEEGSRDGTELFLGHTQCYTVKDKQRDG